METSLARDLMSDDEWAFHERFILAVRAPNGRKPVNHRLGGYFLDCADGLAMARPSRTVRQVVVRLSSVRTLAGLWEQILDALNESRIVPDALQMIDSTVVRAHHQAAGAKGGLRGKVSAARAVASRPRSTCGSTRPACP